jgi:ribonuclease HI
MTTHARDESSAPKKKLRTVRTATVRRPEAQTGTQTGIQSEAAPGGGRRPVELYTDGACSGNPGPGGWGYILRDPVSGKEKEGSGGDPRTTNNRMELQSVIEGLRALTAPAAVTLVSDSEYVVKGLKEWLRGWKARGWRKADKQPVVNVDLWQELDRLQQIHAISPQWIRGHRGHPFNERCDRLAVAAIKELARRGE